MLSTRSLHLALFCLALSCLLFAACGPMPDGMLCDAHQDCLSSERCVTGKCVSIKPKPSAEPALADAAPDAAPGKVPAPKKEKAQPDTDATPDQGCLSPKPTCMAKGVCQGVLPHCVDGAWKCEYDDPAYQKEEDKCDGVDNDCDGTVDEGCDCIDGESRECGLSTGACTAGRQVCQGGQWGACVGGKQPTQEICDGIDNDCDGQVDEAIQRACYDGPSGTKGVGACRAGVQRCEMGAWLACEGQVHPTTETCNNIDDDCDGAIDESVLKQCYTGPAGTQGVGRCSFGVSLCRAGKWGTCTGEVTPQPETCNNQDDDCDGSIDETLLRACYNGPAGTKGVGACKGGTQSCFAGQWGACVGAVEPARETCDGIDNDCDGKVDDLSRTCYGGAGTPGKGICRIGTQTCDNARWGACVGAVTARYETCNGLDDDCDGLTDEGASICVGAGKVCRQGACGCDTSNGYYPYGNLCLKNGDPCPASLQRNNGTCVTSNRWLMCDPHGRVGIMTCSSFTGKGCITNNYGSGCQAQPIQHNRSSCVSLTAGYGANKTWSAVIKGVGVSQYSAIIILDHCAGYSGKNFCGTVVTAGGSATSCLRADRSQYCSGIGTVYDVSTPSTGWWLGSSFGCSFLDQRCTKTSQSGFPVYACH